MGVLATLDIYDPTHLLVAGAVPANPGSAFDRFLIARNSNCSRVYIYWVRKLPPWSPPLADAFGCIPMRKGPRRLCCTPAGPILSSGTRG